MPSTPRPPDRPSRSRAGARTRGRVERASTAALTSGLWRGQSRYLDRVGVGCARQTRPPGDPSATADRDLRSPREIAGSGDPDGARPALARAALDNSVDSVARLPNGHRLAGGVHADLRPCGGPSRRRRAGEAGSTLSGHATTCDDHAGSPGARPSRPRWRHRGPIEPHLWIGGFSPARRQPQRS